MKEFSIYQCLPFTRLELEEFPSVSIEVEQDSKRRQFQALRKTLENMNFDPYTIKMVKNNCRLEENNLTQIEGLDLYIVPRYACRSDVFLYSLHEMDMLFERNPDFLSEIFPKLENFFVEPKIGETIQDDDIFVAAALNGVSDRYEKRESLTQVIEDLVFELELEMKIFPEEENLIYGYMLLKEYCARHHSLYGTQYSNLIN